MTSLNDVKDRVSTTTTNTTNTATTTSSSSSSLQHFGILLLPQCFVGLVDSISFMIITPSLIFYILSFENSSKEQYGIILSIFSFSSFLFKPILGYWCDATGTKFRIPYLVSLIVAALGGLLYFIASAFTGYIGLLIILISRFMGGVGAANSTLGFTYIAAVIPHHHMTKATAILSMIRIFGMTIAPGLNIFLSKIDSNIFGIPITPLNSIGLVLFILNVLCIVVIYFVQKEPQQQISSNSSATMNGHVSHTNNNNDNNNNKNGWQFWKAVLSVDIIVPILCTLSLNANFQLLETGLAPVSHHALQWNPVHISTVFGINSIWIFFMLAVTYYMSSIGITDITMLMIGLITSTTGYALLYFLWSIDTTTILFVLPVLIASTSFPFLAAPARSLFTRVVDGKESLRYSQGTMQAIMSMAASVAGFAAPGLIASFVLRTPEQVEASIDQREFTPYALFAPVSSIIALIGVVYLYMNSTKAPEYQYDVDPSSSSMRPDELAGLLAAERVRHQRRSLGSSIMGIGDMSSFIDVGSNAVAYE